MQHPNSKTFPGDRSEDRNSNDVYGDLEGILLQLQKEAQLADEVFNPEELLLKNISPNKRALIQRMVALQLLNAKSKSNPSQEE